MDQNKGTINKSDMKTDITYILCPDKSCKLFWDTSGVIPCESKCPKQDELVKIVLCPVCREPIELPGDNSGYERVDHLHENGWVSSTFARMSGKYRLLYERPK